MYNYGIIFVYTKTHQIPMVTKKNKGADSLEKTYVSCDDSLPAGYIYSPVYCSR